VNWWRWTWPGSTLRRVREEERGELVAFDMAWVDFEERREKEVNWWRLTWRGSTLRRGERKR
jgi:hypothetical protein